MQKLGIEMPRSEVAYSVEEAVKIAEQLKYPVVLRPAYTMGGAGGGMAEVAAGRHAHRGDAHVDDGRRYRRRAARRRSVRARP